MLSVVVDIITGVPYFPPLPLSTLFWALKN